MPQIIDLTMGIYEGMPQHPAHGRTPLFYLELVIIKHIWTLSESTNTMNRILFHLKMSKSLFVDTLVLIWTPVFMGIRNQIYH